MNFVLIIIAAILIISGVQDFAKGAGCPMHSYYYCQKAAEKPVEKTKDCDKEKK